MKVGGSPRVTTQSLCVTVDEALIVTIWPFRQWLFGYLWLDTVHSIFTSATLVKTEREQEVMKLKKNWFYKDGNRLPKESKNRGWLI